MFYFFPDSINIPPMRHRRLKPVALCEGIIDARRVVFQQLQSSSEKLQTLMFLSFFTPSPQLQLLIGPPLRRKVFKRSLLLTLLAKINYSLQCWVAEQLVLFPSNQRCASNICDHPEKKANKRCEPAAL